MTVGNGIYTLGCIGATLIMGIDVYWWGISGEPAAIKSGCLLGL